MRRFRAALLALGLLVGALGVGSGVLAQQADEHLDGHLTLAAEARVSALDDFTRRARAVTLVASHSSAFPGFYRAAGSREERIQGQSDPHLMNAVHTSLRDVGLLFEDSSATAAFIDRSGAENAAIVRGHRVDPDDLAADRSDEPFFAPTLALQFDSVYQSEPYRSGATGEWVVSTAVKINTGPGLSPGLVHFEFPIESFRLALYGEHAEDRVRVVDLRTGRVVIDSKRPQDVDRPLGNPSDRSLRWVRRSTDGDVRSSDGTRSVVRFAHTGAPIASEWAVVVSNGERTGAWARPTSPGPVLVTGLGFLMLLLSFAGFAQEGRAMARAARTDELTGLLNRMAVREIADAYLAKNRQLAVILFDLDRFKHVNDSLGHHAGDELLAVIAERLVDLVREPDDVVARLGGDEFVVLAHGVQDEDDVRMLCERLIGAITAPARVDGTEVSVGASIGIALAPRHGSDYGTLLQRADIAMYAAKARHGGWQVYHDVFAPDDGAVLSMDVDLRRAVAAGELELHYQYSFTIPEGEPVRAEALVRWRHPTRGLLMPGHFLPMAEATGAVQLVTREVLRLALDQVVAWRAAGRDVVVALNVSAHDVTDPDFADRVTAALAARDLSPSCLLIELTETALLTDPEVAGHVLSRLVSSGVAVGVDDFGAGYAGLLYLRRYPVSVLKLDRSLVRGLLEDPTDAALVRWTVEMAHSLGVACVAEGVQDERTLQALAALGCDEAQGFFLQVPARAEDLPAVVALAHPGI